MLRGAGHRARQSPPSSGGLDARPAPATMAVMGAVGSVGAGQRIMMRGDDGRARPLEFGPGAQPPPLLNSGDTDWAGVPFELHRITPNSAPRSIVPLPGECHLRVVVDGFYEIEMQHRGRTLVRRGVPGTMSFHSGQGPRPLRVAASGQTAVIRLGPQWLSRVLDGTGVPSGIHPLTHGDPTARALAKAMCTEVARGAPTGQLFAESMSLSLLSFALDRLPTQPMRVRGGLADGQCRRLRRYIDERLGGPLKVAELATLCGLQPRHFTTLFQRSFGVTPYQYVVARRVQRGAELLETGSPDIADIAAQVGFASQSHFTTAFRRARGTTPARFIVARRSGNAH